MTEIDWGTRHCAEFAADAVMESTGRDIWSELDAAPPRSWDEARKLYRRKRVRSLEGLVSKVLGRPIDPKRAMRGDVAMVDGALGIVRGDLVEFLDSVQPIGRATKAWKATGKPQPRAARSRAQPSNSARKR